jgi:hypothetical protein
MIPAYQRNLIFVLGKGGVGKTAVSQALALALSRNKKVLWICFEDPVRPTNQGRPLSSPQGNGRLWELNIDPMEAFEEYASLKIGKLGIGGALLTNAITHTFLHNNLIRYLAKAAPGIHELVLLGKVWHERNHYDHVVVDMPSTGYGVAMFQSTLNFIKLFGSGPLARDAEEMQKTFRDPALSGYWIVALPEEMPLREALELDGLLAELFPENRAEFVANRVFPRSKTKTTLESPDQWATPFATSVSDYAAHRAVLEAHNLKMWSNAKIKYDEIEYVLPSEAPVHSALVSKVAAQLLEKIEEL